MPARSSTNFFQAHIRRTKKQEMSEHARTVGALGCSLGGYARAATHTAKQLARMARFAANCRWGKE